MVDVGVDHVAMFRDSSTRSSAHHPSSAPNQRCVMRRASPRDSDGLKTLGVKLLICPRSSGDEPRKPLSARDRQILGCSPHIVGVTADGEYSPKAPFTGQVAPPLGVRRNLANPVRFVGLARLVCKSREGGEVDTGSSSHTIRDSERARCVGFDSRRSYSQPTCRGQRPRIERGNRS
jgi:hypothetical protein